MLVETGDTRYARARNGATPQFVALCKTLYGDLIDPDVIWDDVIKASPDQADTNAHSSMGRQALRGTALTGAVLGGYLGVKEGREGLATLRSAKKLVNRPAQKAHDMRAARRAMGVSGVLGVTDSLEIGSIGSDMHSAAKQRKGSLQPTGAVNKNFFTSAMHRLPTGVKDAAQGLRGHWNQAAKASGLSKPAAGMPKPAMPSIKAVGQTAASAVPTGWQNAGKNAVNMVRTPAGYAGMGTGVVGTVAAGKLRGSGGQQQGSYDLNKAEDVVWKGTFSKLDEDKHLAFGWATVVEINGVPVLDKQGDIIEPEEIEKAAYDYVINSRVGGNMHKRDDQGRFSKVSTGQPYKVSDMVESMVFTDDKVAKMGLPDDFPRGWWVGFKVHDYDTWEQVKKRERTGFSIHGRGIRRDVDLDEAMGYAS